MMVSPEREIECARLVVEMQHYFVGLLEERRREPRNDLLTAVARAADDPELHFDVREQLTVLSIDLLASGNETTTAAITSGLKLLIEDPAALAAVRRDPRLLRNLAEEVLRLESPAQGMFRRVTRDTVLGGIALREGDLLSVRFGAANRDETQFPQADRIDLHRSQPGKHLALGIGRHHCIGAQLARQEIISALGRLLERYTGFTLTPGCPGARLPAQLLRTQPAAAVCHVDTERGASEVSVAAAVAHCESRLAATSGARAARTRRPRRPPACRTTCGAP